LATPEGHQQVYVVSSHLLASTLYIEFVDSNKNNDQSPLSKSVIIRSRLPINESLRKLIQKSILRVEIKPKRTGKKVLSTFDIKIDNSSVNLGEYLRFPFSFDVPSQQPKIAVSVKMVEEKAEYLLSGCPVKIRLVPKAKEISKEKAKIGSAASPSQHSLTKLPSSP